MKNKIDKEVLKEMDDIGERHFKSSSIPINEFDKEEIKKAIKLTQQKTAQAIFDELEVTSTVECPYCNEESYYSNPKIIKLIKKWGCK